MMRNNTVRSSALQWNWRFSPVWTHCQHRGADPGYSLPLASSIFFLQCWERLHQSPPATQLSLCSFLLTPRNQTMQCFLIASFRI